MTSLTEPETKASLDSAPAAVRVEHVWIVGIVAVFVPLAVWRYRRMS
jgi:hypothetical protein